MVYCNLKGGLGNMLFQIAACKAISLEKNTDCSFPNYHTHLNVLNEDKEFNPKLRHAQEYSKFLSLNSDSPNQPLKLYNFPFEYTEFLPTENFFIIDGFFQTEKYFIKYKQEILNFLSPTEEINNIISTKYPFLLTKVCTSVHIRRGDYLKYSNHHPTQTLDYYYEAIKRINNNELFVIFSDDIEWCKNNFKFKNVFFVQNEKDYIEIFLMSKCTNNIIANSSFSWWGAWLNQHDNKVVVGPSKWFGNSLHHLNTNDIIPNTWIKI